MIYIVAPLSRTGGPEALHQLADTLSELGIDCRIFYVDKGEALRSGYLRMAAQDNLYPEYAGVQIADAITGLDLASIVRPKDCVLLPETLIEFSLVFSPETRKYLWWLSFDYAVRSIYKLSMHCESIPDFLNQQSITSLAQSAYQAEVLRALGVDQSKIGMLSDYIKLPPLVAEPAQAVNPGEKLVYGFNPKKCKSLSDNFAALHPSATPCPLVNLTRLELLETLGACHAYIEFGNLPGKDRMPREALLLGKPVLIRKQGAGMFPEEWDLPEDCYFDTSEIYDGSLFSRLSRLTAHPKDFHQEAERARSHIHGERERFRSQCEQVFSSHNA
jgi:hypothetical protein